MSLFLETILILDGRARNLEFHNARFNKTRREHFGRLPSLDLSGLILVPENLRKKEKLKCRIVYDREIREISYTPYKLHKIKSLRLVRGDHIDYHLKYFDRSALDKLYRKRGLADDILIIKNNLITDSYYCNVAFKDDKEWHTPSEPLLEGTRRAHLLERGKLSPRNIHPRELKEYRICSLFNAMIDLEEIMIPVSSIHTENYL